VTRVEMLMMSDWDDPSSDAGVARKKRRINLDGIPVGESDPTKESFSSLIRKLLEQNLETLKKEKSDRNHVERPTSDAVKDGDSG
jgi:hypothetical protein